MNPPFNGPERRKMVDSQKSIDTETRLALLERAALDADVRHKENKDSLIAVHKRLTESHKALAYELKLGIEAVLRRMDEEKDSRTAQCKEHSDRTTKLENNMLWIDRWVLAVSTGVLMIFGWIATHIQNVSHLIPKGKS